MIWILLEDGENYTPINDGELKEKSNSCNQSVVDSEFEKGRHCVCNVAMSCFNNSFFNDKMDNGCKQLKLLAEVNLAFGFVLKYIDDGTFRNFYAHKNKTVMETCKLVCTQDDVINLKENLQKKVNVEHCTRKKAYTNWSFYKNMKTMV